MNAPQLIEKSPWPEPVDIFEQRSAPCFPLEVLPEVAQQFCRDQSAASGFDVGGYGFALMIAMGAATDHRNRLDMGPFRVPPHCWGALNAASGDGKSPTLGEAGGFLSECDKPRLQASRERMAEYFALEAKERPEQKPEWHQRVINDATTEAMVQLAKENPPGLALVLDEFTEIIGRMDAYGGKGSEKDRGVYIGGFDGRSVTVNRATKAHLHLDHFSLAILTGVQPEVLKQHFSKRGASDGLLQRFLHYTMRPASDADYFATGSSDSAGDLLAIFRTLDDNFGDMGALIQRGMPISTELDPDAKQLAQQFQNAMRHVAKTTPEGRFSEHLGKFPGLLGRVAFILHLAHAAADGSDPRLAVDAETMQKALTVMRVLYRHSEAVYSELDKAAHDVRHLAETAAEAILAKSYGEFMRGDLTRNATHWQGADERSAEAAINLLIEFHWITDITIRNPNRPGRRSAGHFRVNPRVHEMFVSHAERVQLIRSKRHESLMQAVGGAN